MIICHDFQQGSMEWLRARLGVVTASCFGEVVTGTTCKASASQKTYAYKLAAESITGEPLDGYKSLEMFQGNALEGEARAAYTLLTGAAVDQVGLIYLDEQKRVGASPDGLVRGADGYAGGCEIKNVAPHTQVKYLYIGGIPAEYRPQVYGSLYVSGLPWWDFFSASPGMAPHLVRVTADDEKYLKYATALDVELPKMIALVDEVIAKVSSA